mmetsp:Transcript_46016/g.115842  ORF Transcript_46016/g.115842 Transcript_46016/m.115842 type:complete len:259 (-) Transcript_46016:22-798(-)
MRPRAFTCVHVRSPAAHRPPSVHHLGHKSPEGHRLDPLFFVLLLLLLHLLLHLQLLHLLPLLIPDIRLLDFVLAGALLSLFLEFLVTFLVLSGALSHDDVLGRPVDCADGARVQTDHLGAQLVQEVLHLHLPPLLARLKWIRLVRVKVGFTRAWHKDTAHAGCRANAQDILVGAKHHVAGEGTLDCVVHVRRFLLVRACNVFPQLDGGTERHGQHIPLAEGQAGGGVGGEVVVEQLVCAQVPHFHPPVCARCDHVVPS